MLAAESLRSSPLDRFNQYFFELVTLFSHAQTNEAVRSKEITSLSERIKLYGKVRFLFICDENLGRSRIFAIAVSKKLKDMGLDEYAESVSAGTDVNEKGSKYKYDDGLHPAVKAEEGSHGVHDDFNEPTQLDESFATPNTIAVILNNPSKTSKAFKKRCFKVIEGYLHDPGNLEHQKLSYELGQISLAAYAFGFDLTTKLRMAVAKNKMPKYDFSKVDMQQYAGIGADFL